jgi:hypothetical protein
MRLVSATPESRNLKYQIRKPAMIRGTTIPIVTPTPILTAEEELEEAAADIELAVGLEIEIGVGVAEGDGVDEGSALKLASRRLRHGSAFDGRNTGRTITCQ